MNTSENGPNKRSSTSFLPRFMRDKSTRRSGNLCSSTRLSVSDKAGKTSRAPWRRISNTSRQSGFINPTDAEESRNSQRRRSSVVLERQREWNEAKKQLDKDLGLFAFD